MGFDKEMILITNKIRYESQCPIIQEKMPRVLFQHCKSTFSLEFEKDQATLKSLQYLYQLVFRFALFALDEGQQEQWPHTLLENTGVNR